MLKRTLFVGLDTPEVSDTLPGHLENCARTGTMWTIFAAGLRTAVVNGQRVRFCDRCPAVLAYGTTIWPVAVAVVWSRAHPVDTVARGPVVHRALLVMKTSVKTTTRRQHVVCCIAQVPLLKREQPTRFVSSNDDLLVREICIERPGQVANGL